MSVQADLCWTLTEIPKTGFLMSRLILCMVEGRFVLDLDGNPKDMFSHVAAHVMYGCFIYELYETSFLWVMSS